MINKKRAHPKEKPGLHPRNPHRERYNFKQLTASCPEMKQFVILNEFGDESVDFFNPLAVKMLNKALLKHFYGIDHWDIPKNYLCPPIPGRADYIHHLADLLGNRGKEGQENKIPIGESIKCLDIGMGANCIYPLIGNKVYGWSFVGSDIDAVSIENARKIVEMNPVLKDKIECRLQTNPKNTFTGIIQRDEVFDLSVCNPPFHASATEAQSGTVRKIRNLKHNKQHAPILNFGGQNNELWCEGGEIKFITDLIYQSKHFAASVFWFSSLVSKETNLRKCYQVLKNVKATEIKTIPMNQGNKTSRIVAWTFLNEEEQLKWIKTKWL